ncbi:hypothetical protein [Tunturiibacter lichenicola]|uniref:hypothetical protein n=1 Tax=Tunturiibacter lichenicola TaxID=2051959 RepID=UPI0021B47586|nr:hypothetical protein [Edaphobacter lichenicola]
MAEARRAEADPYGITAKEQTNADAGGTATAKTEFPGYARNENLFERCGNLFVVGITMLFCWAGVIKWSLLVLFLAWFERIRERF